MAVKNPRTIRILGAVQILCGLFLITVMGLLLHWMGGQLAQPGVQQADGSTFRGTAEQAWWIVRLFWAILGFGVVAIGTGVAQMVMGRRHPANIAVILVAFAAVALMTWRTVSIIR